MNYALSRMAFLLLVFGVEVCDAIPTSQISDESQGRVPRQSEHPAYICARATNSSNRIHTAGIFNSILCDAQTDGGGWIVILKRFNGRLGFVKDWTTYAYGFGDVNHEFWMGNYYLFLLTSGGHYFLRVDMTYKGKKYYAKYSSFKIFPEKDEYKLRVSSFIEGDAGDSLSFHNNSKFSTFDRDNSMVDVHCISEAQAPWWFHNCHKCLLFGKWNEKSYGKGINWLTLTGYTDSVNSVEMKIKFDSKWY